MTTEFELIHNYHERAVYAAVIEKAAEFPQLREAGLLADVACVALNRLPPRYIRHDVDFIFYLTDKERAENHAAVDEAVSSALVFVQKRVEAKLR
jgi:hypothetical protein